MQLYDSIVRRKSCRKYVLQPLAEEMLAKIEAAIAGFSVLYPDESLQWRFTNKVKGLYHVQAPHYLIVSGQKKAGEQESTGFLFEQLCLWFDAMEIGCVWLGESKDAERTDTKNDIIAIGFGAVEGSVHRNPDEFKRKPIESITNAPDDLCMQAVHLAPSGMNLQPWYFEKCAEDGSVLVYKQKLKPPASLVYKLVDLDLGIALCHYALACEKAGKAFRFLRTTELAKKTGYLPFGRIE